MTPEERERSEWIDRQFGELQELVLRLDRVMEEQARVVAEQAQAQSRTDDRLSVLIGVVERYFPSGRN